MVSYHKTQKMTTTTELLIPKTESMSVDCTVVSTGFVQKRLLSTPPTKSVKSSLKKINKNSKLINLKENIAVNPFVKNAKIPVNFSIVQFKSFISNQRQTLSGIVFCAGDDHPYSDILDIIGLKYSKERNEFSHHSRTSKKTEPRFITLFSKNSTIKSIEIKDMLPRYETPMINRFDFIIPDSLLYDKSVVLQLSYDKRRNFTFEYKVKITFLNGATKEITFPISFYVTHAYKKTK